MPMGPPLMPPDYHRNYVFIGIAAAPDVILKMNNGNMVGAPDEIFSLPAFTATPAAAKRALIGMDGLYLLGFGPRSPDAVREALGRANGAR